MVSGNAPGAVAIVWPSEATADRAEQQRFAEALRQALALPPHGIVMGAMDRARRVAAYEVERERLDALVQAHEHLERARAKFRGGQLEGAEGDLAASIAVLSANPALPGAARLAYAVHVLRARIAWTRGDVEGARLSILEALVLDPHATVSTRRVPPDFAAEYQLIQAELLAGASGWPEWSIPPGDGLDVEIDGRPGSRPVPPGRHFVVVRRLGHAPRGFLLHTDDPWSLPEGALVLAPGFDGEAQARAICERLRVDHVLVAERREPRWGVQAFACGSGFGRPIFVRDARLSQALPDAFAGPFHVPFVLADTWPSEHAVLPTPPRPVTGPEPAPAGKPWYRRVWVWTLLGAVVVGGATTAAVLTTRPPPPPRVEIPGPDFLGP